MQSLPSFTDIQNRSYPNVLKNDKWVFSFSNIPTLPYYRDMKYFDSYIKSFTLPGYSVPITNIDMEKGFQFRQPMGGMDVNRNFTDITIEFNVSEDMLNYLTIWKWIFNLRNGTEVPKDSPLRHYSCGIGTLSLLDNLKRPVAKYHFTHMLPSDLTSLNFVSGQTEDLTFTVTFKYEEFGFELFDPLNGGSNPTAPTIVSQCGIVTPINTQVEIAE